MFLSRQRQLQRKWNLIHRYRTLWLIFFFGKKTHFFFLKCSTLWKMVSIWTATDCTRNTCNQICANVQYFFSVDRYCCRPNSGWIWKTREIFCLLRTACCYRLQWGQKAEITTHCNSGLHFSRSRVFSWLYSTYIIPSDERNECDRHTCAFHSIWLKHFTQQIQGKNNSTQMLHPVVSVWLVYWNCFARKMFWVENRFEYEIMLLYLCEQQIKREIEIEFYLTVYLPLCCWCHLCVSRAV